MSNSFKNLISTASRQLSASFGGDPNRQTQQITPGEESAPVEAPQQYQFYVHIVNATGLKKCSQKHPSSNPMVKVHFAGLHQARTKPIKQTLDPNFHEEFLFTSPNRTSFMLFKVVHVRKGKKSLPMGKAYLKVDVLQDGVIHEADLDIGEGGSGKIKVIFRVDPLGSWKPAEKLSDTFTRMIERVAPDKSGTRHLRNFRLYVAKEEYQPGEIVRGMVVYVCRKPMFYLTIQLSGLQTSVIIIEKRRGESTTIISYGATYNFFTTVPTLLGTNTSASKTQAIHPHDIHVFPFEFQLPYNLPASQTVNSKGKLSWNSGWSASFLTNYVVVAKLKSVSKNPFHSGSKTKKIKTPLVLKANYAPHPSVLASFSLAPKSVETAYHKAGKKKNKAVYHEDIIVDLQAPTIIRAGDKIDLIVSVQNQGEKSVGLIKVLLERYVWTVAAGAKGKWLPMVEKTLIQFWELSKANCIEGTSVIPIPTGGTCKAVLSGNLASDLLPTIPEQVSPLGRVVYFLKTQVMVGSILSKTKAQRDVPIFVLPSLINTIQVPERPLLNNYWPCRGFGIPKFNSAYGMKLSAAMSLEQAQTPLQSDTIIGGLAPSMIQSMNDTFTIIQAVTPPPPTEPSQFMMAPDSAAHTAPQSQKFQDSQSGIHPIQSMQHSSSASYQETQSSGMPGMAPLPQSGLLNSSPINSPEMSRGPPTQYTAAPYSPPVQNHHTHMQQAAMVPNSPQPLTTGLPPLHAHHPPSTPFVPFENQQFSTPHGDHVTPANGMPLNSPVPSPDSTPPMAPGGSPKHALPPRPKFASISRPLSHSSLQHASSAPLQRPLPNTAPPPLFTPPTAVPPPPLVHPSNPVPIFAAPPSPLTTSGDDTKSTSPMRDSSQAFQRPLPSPAAEPSSLGQGPRFAATSVSTSHRNRSPGMSIGQTGRSHHESSVAVMTPQALPAPTQSFAPPPAYAQPTTPQTQAHAQPFTPPPFQIHQMPPQAPLQAPEQSLPDSPMRLSSAQPLALQHASPANPAPQSSPSFPRPPARAFPLPPGASPKESPTTITHPSRAPLASTSAPLVRATPLASSRPSVSELMYYSSGSSSSVGSPGSPGVPHPVGSPMLRSSDSSSSLGSSGSSVVMRTVEYEEFVATPSGGAIQVVPAPTTNDPSRSQHGLEFKDISIAIRPANYWKYLIPDPKTIDLYSHSRDLFKHAIFGEACVLPREHFALLPTFTAPFLTGCRGGILMGAGKVWTGGGIGGNGTGTVTDAVGTVLDAADGSLDGSIDIGVDVDVEFDADFDIDMDLDFDLGGFDIGFDF